MTGSSKRLGPRTAPSVPSFGADDPLPTQCPGCSLRHVFVEPEPDGDGDRVRCLTCPWMANLRPPIVIVALGPGVRPKRGRPRKKEEGT